MVQLTLPTITVQTPSRKLVTKLSGLKPLKLMKGDQILLKKLCGEIVLGVFHARFFDSLRKPVNIVFFPDLAESFNDEKYGYCHISDYQLRTRGKLQK
jgi:hypothetical protein